MEELRCKHCGNAGVSILHNHEFYCSKCFEELFSSKYDTIKLPMIVPTVRTRPKRSWRTRASKYDYIRDIPIEAIEI